MKRLFVLILLLMITTGTATAQTVRTQEKQEIKIMLSIKGQKIAFNIPIIRK